MTEFKMILEQISYSAKPLRHDNESIDRIHHRYAEEHRPDCTPKILLRESWWGLQDCKVSHCRFTGRNRESVRVH